MKTKPQTNAEIFLNQYYSSFCYLEPPLSKEEFENFLTNLYIDNDVKRKTHAAKLLFYYRNAALVMLYQFQTVVLNAVVSGKRIDEAILEANTAVKSINMLLNTLVHYNGLYLRSSMIKENLFSHRLELLTDLNELRKKLKPEYRSKLITASALKTIPKERYTNIFKALCDEYRK